VVLSSLDAAQRHPDHRVGCRRDHRGRGVPPILVGTQKMSGFSEQGLEALLSRAGR